MTTSTPAPERTLVIVPAYNEADNLPSVIGDLRRHAADCDIAVVDDHSTDRTVAVARSLGVALLRLPYNLGIGGAVQTGFRFAKSRGFAYALQFDGDGQHPADQIDGLLAPLRAGQADAVIGSRFLDPRGFQSTRSRRLAIRMFRRLSRRTSGIDIQDPTSGFRAYNARAVSFLADHYPSDYPEVESITHLARAGFRVAEVPVTMRERRGGRSSITAARSLYYLAKVSLAALVSSIRSIPGGRQKKT